MALLKVLNDGNSSQSRSRLKAEDVLRGTEAVTRATKDAESVTGALQNRGGRVTKLDVYSRMEGRRLVGSAMGMVGTDIGSDSVILVQGLAVYAEERRMLSGGCNVSVQSL